MKKVFFAAVAATAVCALALFVGCGEQEGGEQNNPTDQTEVTYEFVNGTQSFRFTQTQKAGSALGYEYDKVDYKNEWYTAADMQTAVSVAEGKSMTVYTAYTDYDVFCMFRSQNKTLTELAMQTTVREGLTLPAAPAREGYVFTGWQLEEKSYAAGESVPLASRAQDVIFTAGWAAKSFSVTYVVDGQSDTLTQDYDDAVKTAPEKTGYLFLGWYEGNEKIEKVTGETTLTAKWQPVRYAVEFDLGGYTGAFAYENGDFDYAQTIALSDLNRTGYTFEGWQIKVDNGDYRSFSGTYTAGSDLTAQNITFKATFSPKMHAVTVVGKSGNHSVQLKTDELIYPALETYVQEGFSGWYSDGAHTVLLSVKERVSPESADSFTIYGSFDGTKYTATLKNGSETKTEQYAYGETFEQPEGETGYKFEGWFDAAGDCYETMPVGNISLTAKFVKMQFTLSYNGNGVTAPESVVVDYLSETTVAAIEGSVPYKQFGGWQYNGEIYRAGDTIALTENTELVAVWNSYNVRVTLTDWDGYSIFDSTVEAGWHLAVPAGSVYENVGEFAGFYTTDIYGKIHVIELGTQIGEDFVATAYYVNNSSNPATQGQRLNFVDVNKLFFALNSDGKTYSVSGREWWKEVDSSGNSINVMSYYWYGESMPNDLVLPAVYQGKLVTSIPDGYLVSTGAFSVASSSKPYNYDLYRVRGTVYIPSSYRTIGVYAFSGQSAKTLEIGRDSAITHVYDSCNFLMEANRVYGFPRNLWYVGSYALTTGQYTEGDSQSFIMYYDDGTQITELPSAIRYIRSSAFVGCDVFTHMDLSNVVSIGSRAFSGLTNLETVTIGTKITSIPAELFSDCSSLREIYIPAQITKISSRAFIRCPSLRNVTFEQNGSKLKTIEFFAFYAAPLTEVILPDSVEEIGSAAFSYTFASAVPSWSVNDDITSEITKIKLSANIKSIASFAFTGAQITSIEFPEGLERIGAASFFNTNLKKVEFPDSVTTIEDVAFAKIKSKYLTSADGEFVLHFGKNLTTLGGKTSEFVVNVWPHGQIFRGFNNIVGIEFDEECNLRETESYTFADMRGLKGEIVFPSKTERIGSSLFIFSEQYNNNPYWVYDPTDGAAITKVTVPASVNEIGGFAFSYCKSLTEVVFEDNYSSDASLFCFPGIFEGCTGLKSVSFPVQLTKLTGGTIGYKSGAFFNCTSLETVTFRGRYAHDGGRDSALTISSVTFSGCRALKNVIIQRTDVIDIEYSTYFGETDANNCMFEDCVGVRVQLAKEMEDAFGLRAQYNQSRWYRSNCSIVVSRT